KAYNVWHGILSRCYSPKNTNYKNYGGHGVTVCDEWLVFQNFARWYLEQYSEPNWHIDKDILVKGNKIYSPETCCIIPGELNTIISNKKTRAFKIEGILDKYQNVLPERVITSVKDLIKTRKEYLGV
ncbi:MAG TPA: hypothetical protein VFM18_23950, partial [Methanosarcina sp.]|nr:hypothetical protein [Methanosarcina sp.]